MASEKKTELFAENGHFSSEHPPRNLPPLPLPLPFPSSPAHLLLLLASIH